MKLFKAKIDADQPKAVVYEKNILLLGLTGSGKSNIIGLYEKAYSQTKISPNSVTKRDVEPIPVIIKHSENDEISKFTFYDTVGYMDTKNNENHTLKIIKYIFENKINMDIVFMFVRFDRLLNRSKSEIADIINTITTYKLDSRKVCFVFTYCDLYNDTAIEEYNTELDNCGGFDFKKYRRIYIGFGNEKDLKPCYHQQNRKNKEDASDKVINELVEISQLNLPAFTAEEKNCCIL